MTRLRTLPKARDSISFLYFDHCRIEQDDFSIAVFQKESCYRIPCANISTLLLGPGSVITHAAVKTLGENLCTIQWVGEDALRFYACGRSGASGTDRLLHQVAKYSDPAARLAVVRRMYAFRFQEELSVDLTLQQIRGMEGVRMRTIYQRLSKATGVEWSGRSYRTEAWDESSEINKALSIANFTLYSVCQAVLQSVGYLPALGFVHTGKPLSFVYDVADLYKGETSIPAAFEAVSSSYLDLSGLVRRKCREKFTAMRLMSRIVDDLDRILEFRRDPGANDGTCYLWDDHIDRVEGGKDWSQLGE